MAHPSCSRCWSENVSNLECENNCKFCNTCITRFIFTAYENGKLEFICPNTACNANITNNSLRDVFGEKWNKLIYRRRLSQLNEVHHQNLELCPCCERVAVLNQKKGCFSCLNPRCLKEICVACKSDAHFGIECERMGNIQVGMCNTCGNKYFDNTLERETTSEIDQEKLMKVACESEEYRRPQKRRSFFRKVVGYCTDDITYETIAIVGLSTISTYLVMRYYMETL